MTFWFKSIEERNLGYTGSPSQALSAEKIPDFWGVKESE